MAISVFELFSIGIGPSSSHTLGPMRAANEFLKELHTLKVEDNVHKVIVDLYGSLALTGKGHCTDIAVMLGLEGDRADLVDPDSIPDRIAAMHDSKQLSLNKKRKVDFEVHFHKEQQLEYHPNGMKFTALNESGTVTASHIYYSIGGGFILDDRDIHASQPHQAKAPPPFPFESGHELLTLCSKHHMTIAQLMMENEKTWRSEEEIRRGILNIWNVMQKCIDRGCREEGTLPGGLNVRRRAAPLARKLQNSDQNSPALFIEWVSLWALAVNEENAAGSRVVTAPTNGSAGVIPAVLKYYQKMTPSPTDDGIVTFFLTSAAIGILFKKNASISAAEMGCMGEVGVACSMAAAGLVAALGGSALQVENAAEIGMEHNLGLTCDPIMGLVQIPCIERNTMGAVKAINAAYLALREDGAHRVSLDQVIATMRQTGIDMMSIYKETSLGGLAANVPEC
jgi:L-serine dehydratase